MAALSSQSLFLHLSPSRSATAAALWALPFFFPANALVPANGSTTPPSIALRAIASASKGIGAPPPSFLPFLPFLPAAAEDGGVAAAAAAAATAADAAAVLSESVSPSFEASANATARSSQIKASQSRAPREASHERPSPPPPPTPPLSPLAAAAAAAVSALAPNSSRLACCAVRSRARSVVATASVVRSRGSKPMPWRHLTQAGKDRQRFSMPSTSFPNRSRDTLLTSASTMVGCDAASPISGSSSNRNRCAKRTARSTRSGSSLKVSKGGSGVATLPWFKSFSPLPVKSSTTKAFKL
mmetsp:Transcript_4051/g.7552  ORF Transcript_4051/g.7552 Transcript_4051/m.7552 type:complete len:299 (-) Transcript_4051:632-1528(-)